MSDRPICRVGDKIEGTCNASGGDHPRSCTGIWETGSEIGMVDGIPIVRVGDTGTTDCGHPFVAITGSLVAECDGRYIVCIGDLVDISGGSGVTVTGSDTASSF